MKNRSFFWPLTLIAVGVIWLLVSMKVIPSANLWALTHIWPFVLIVLGLGMILRGFFNFPGWILSALVVGGAAAAVLFAPQLGWAGGPDWRIDPDFGGAVAGSGRIDTETREVGDFDAISIEYPAEIEIRQGESESVTVEADDNLLPQLTTEVEGGTLVIENGTRDWSKRVNPSEAVRITIVVTDLSRIDFRSAGKLSVQDLETDELALNLSGAGEVDVNGLDVRRFESNLSGAGDIEVEGTADEMKLGISGLGSFDGSDFSTLTASVRISGAGNATLRVEDELDAAVSGAGSIDYYGSPHVTQSISGAGSVNQIGE